MTSYTKDEYKKDILLSSQGSQVMMEWEKPYMEACIDAIEPEGDVLEIGFGLGYSATHILNYKPKSYTIIECEPIVIKRIKQWAKKYPHTPIYIIEGRWQDTLHKLGKFDSIFFDDFPLEINEKSNKIEYVLSVQRYLVFIDQCIQYHTRINAKISMYSNNQTNNIGLSCDIMPFIQTENRDIEVFIPNNCKYREIGLHKCSIIIIKKVKEFDIETSTNFVNKVKKQVNFNNDEISKKLETMLINKN